MVLDPGSTGRISEIRRRWIDSGDQRAAVAKALQRRELALANDSDDLKERSKRLERRGLRLEGIVESDDSVWLSFFECGLTAARAVGRIVTTPARQPVRAIGTGSLVTDWLLLTNNHVCPAVEEAEQMAVQFNYEYDDLGQERSLDQWPLAPAQFFFTNPTLDFTLVAVTERDGDAPGSTYGHIPLIGRTGKAVKAEAVNVIHHPAGDRKRVSLRYNRMVAEDDLWIRYESDTREGSSGAPVFNDQWEMIGLHHGGVSPTDDEGYELARTGERWTEAMGEEALAYVGNEAARVSRIVRSLRQAELRPEERALVADILKGSE